MPQRIPAGPGLPFSRCWQPCSRHSPSRRGPCAGAGERSDPAVRRHAVRCLVNNARATNGLPRLRSSSTRARREPACARHGAARLFRAHEPGRLDARDPGQARGIPRAVDGETIAFAVPAATPARTVRGWLRSAAHRRILLSPAMRDMGVGIARGAPLAGGTRRGATVVLDAGSG